MSPVEVDLFYFFPVVLAAYWLGPRTRTWQNLVLLFAGYLFFVSWSGSLLFALVAGTLVDFALLRYLGRQPAPAGHRRLVLWVAVLGIVAEILYFKYQGFLATSLQALLSTAGFSASLAVVGILAPVGLSFRALQRISVYVDVYRGRQEAPQHLLDYAVFSAFFPQMLAGPITRAAQLLAPLGQPRGPSAALWARGAWALLIGFTLKAFCADVIGTRLVDPVFQDHASFTTGAHWLALVGFALQVFGDFAGYSLIAIGLALFCSIELPTNFNFPFISRTLSEFWRRWHITLNSWLFDYIFFPLTVDTRLFRGRVIPAFFITFMVSGLWHGASWTFVAWGALQAVGLTIQTLWERRFATLARADRRWVQWRRSAAYGRGAWLLTQGFFIVTLVPFRAGSFAQAVGFAHGLLASAGLTSLALANPQLVAALIVIVLYQFTPLPTGQRVIAWFQLRPPLLQGMAVGIAVVLLLILTPAGSGTFIYAQF